MILYLVLLVFWTRHFVALMEVDTMKCLSLLRILSRDSCLKWYHNAMDHIMNIVLVYQISVYTQSMD